MNAARPSADKPGKRGKGKPVDAGADKGGHQLPTDDRGMESAMRRNRRVQHKDQQNQWRKSAGGCWPSPPAEDGETE